MGQHHSRPRPQHEFYVEEHPSTLNCYNRVPFTFNPSHIQKFLEKICLVWDGEPSRWTEHAWAYRGVDKLYDSWEWDCESQKKTPPSSPFPLLSPTPRRALHLDGTLTKARGRYENQTCSSSPSRSTGTSR